MEKRIRRAVEEAGMKETSLQELDFIDAEEELPKEELDNLEETKKVVLHLKFKESTEPSPVKILLDEKLNPDFHVLTYEGSRTDNENEVKLLVAKLEE